MKREIIAKRMLVLLTGMTLAKAASAETDLGFRLTSSTLKKDKPMLAEQILDSFGCNGRNNLLPAGCRQGRTDFGPPGYGGPCPPAGDPPHHYLFTVYALDIDKLDVGEAASPAMIGFAMHQHVLAKAVLPVTYGR